MAEARPRHVQGRDERQMCLTIPELALELPTALRHIISCGWRKHGADCCVCDLTHSRTSQNDVCATQRRKRILSRPTAKFALEEL